MHSPVPFGLLKPGIVVERRHAIEPERDVGAGADEFGGVDHAGLQAGEDFRRRRGLRRRAEPPIDLAAEPERADLQSRATSALPLISRRNQPPMQTPVLPPMNGFTPNGA